MSTQTPDYIANLLAQRSRELQLAKPRELHIANSDKMTTFSQDHSQNHTSPREVSKEENIKRSKDISRDQCEDIAPVKVSARPAPCLEANASQPVAVTTSQEPLEEGLLSQKAFGSDITPARTTTRYTGISVQHARTSKGVKLSITLQTAEQAEFGGCYMVTAELKRYDRLREVRVRDLDSEHFAQYLEQAIDSIRYNQNKSACVGRLHERNKRTQWLQDAVAIGILSNDRIVQVLLYLEGEEYAVDLDQELSTRQARHYHTAGIVGSIRSAARAPRLSDLPVVKFGG